MATETPPSPVTLSEVSGLSARPTRVRYGVLAFLCSLAFILYVDRVCINQAEQSIRRDLGITKDLMGFVFGAFTLAYGLFEVPTGRWGDRYGSRGVLTRIVLWWSAFTALTGAATSFVMLLAVRFLFGAGEAGAFPNVARVLMRWFPAGARGWAQGIVVTSSQLGGALAPAVAAYLIATIGWRWSFTIFGGLGVVWAWAFYVWFRDDPAAHPAVNEAERQLLAADDATVPMAEQHPPVPWARVFRSANVWLLGMAMNCGAFVFYMYITWYPTYLKEGRNIEQFLPGGQDAPRAEATLSRWLASMTMAGGAAGPMAWYPIYLDEGRNIPQALDRLREVRRAEEIFSGWLASMVLIGGAAGCIVGGYLADWVVRRTGSRRWSRRLMGCAGFSLAAIALLTSVRCESPWMATTCVAVACMSVQMQVPTWWAVVTEISGRHLGTLFGLMNSMGVPGAFLSPIFLGKLVTWLESQGYAGRAQWDPAFYVYGGALVIGALCWLFIDPMKSAVEPPGTDAEGAAS